MKKFNVFLIRHGFSEKNAGIYSGTPDYKIPLTTLGVEQAEKSAGFLAEYVKSMGVSLVNARGWTSPYKRTRDTADIFQKIIGFKELREELYLIEKQFGQFEWTSYEEWKKVNPEAFEHYSRCQELDAKVFAQLPLGESPIQVALRARPFLGTIARDRDEKGINTIFIFTHGVTLRALVYQLMHYNLEWYENAKNPGNCWVRHIERIGEGKYTDYGYIYQG